MNAMLRYGLILGTGVVAWTFLMGITGWYIHPTLLNMFWMVIAIQIAVLFMGMRATALPGMTYWGQVKMGTMMSLIGGVAIFVGSVIFTSVVFPNYFVDLHHAATDMMRAQGMGEQQITQLLEAQAATQTTFWQAMFGFIGTAVTGLVVSLILAAFVKPKTNA